MKPRLVASPRGGGYRTRPDNRDLPRPRQHNIPMLGQRIKQLPHDCDTPMGFIPLGCVFAGAAGEDVGRVAYNGAMNHLRLSAYHFG